MQSKEKQRKEVIFANSFIYSAFPIENDGFFMHFIKTHYWGQCVFCVPSHKFEIFKVMEFNIIHIEFKFSPNNNWLLPFSKLSKRLSTF